MLPEFLKIIIATVPEGTPILLLALPGALMTVAGYALVKRGRRHRVAVYEVGQPQVFSDPVSLLYLRPFVVDKSPAEYVRSPFRSLFLLPSLLNKWDRTWLRLQVIEGVTRHEELLAFAFRRVGTLITIGDPRESLPLLGAVRIYSALPDSTESVDEAAWKIEVERQIAAARLILLHIGTSEGIRWEVAKVVQIADPQRLVLCVNPPRKFKPGLSNLYHAALRAEIKDAWSRFRDTFEAVFPHGLPEVIGDARFISFDVNWTARPIQPTKRKIAWFIPGRNPDLSRKTIESALAWLTWMMVPEPFGRRFVRRSINYISYIIIIIAFILLLFAVAAL
jgi:hypothetical protein